MLDPHFQAVPTRFGTVRAPRPHDRGAVDLDPLGDCGKLRHSIPWKGCREPPAGPSGRVPNAVRGTHRSVLTEAGAVTDPARGVGLGAREPPSQGGEATMPSQKRRAAGRRRAWGRGPIILRFESLEGRQLLATSAQALARSGRGLVRHGAQPRLGRYLPRRGQDLEPGRRAGQRRRSTSRSSPRPRRPSAPRSVPLGEVTIPAGLGAGPVEPFRSGLHPAADADPRTIAPGDPIYIGPGSIPRGRCPRATTKNNHGSRTGLRRLARHDHPAPAVAT